VTKAPLHTDSRSATPVGECRKASLDLLETEHRCFNANWAWLSLLVEAAHPSITLLLTAKLQQTILNAENVFSCPAFASVTLPLLMALQQQLAGGAVTS